MLWVGVLVVVGVAGPCLGDSYLNFLNDKLCLAKHSCDPKNKFSSDHLTMKYFYFTELYANTPRGCSCTAACRRYGDCCRDSQHYDEAEQRRNSNEYVCVQTSVSLDYVYMVGKCVHGWKDIEVEALCLKGNTVSDPKMALPVTNTASDITYVNSYCAICNGVDPASLRMWYYALSCDLPDYSEFPDSLQHDTVFKNGSWGFIPRNSDGGSFEPCSSELRKPENVSTTPCEPTINTCDDSQVWSDGVHSLCQSYTAAVYAIISSETRRFRNEHCASCNGYKGDTNCYGKAKPSLYQPFSMLLDFSDRTGSEYVGLIGNCGADEVWDRYYGKCRKVFCPKQGQKFLRGRCVGG